MKVKIIKTNSLDELEGKINDFLSIDDTVEVIDYSTYIDENNKVVFVAYITYCLEVDEFLS